MNFRLIFRRVLGEIVVFVHGSLDVVIKSDGAGESVHYLEHNYYAGSDL
mgnify:CR=1 FL=1